jgi:hypothetical protein
VIGRQPRRDWSDVDIDAHTPCLVCGIEGRTERAHVAGRRYDEKRGKIRYVNPLDIVPLCGPTGDHHSCHHRFDAGDLDLLPYLDLPRQIRVVAQMGGIENARIRLAPSDYHRAIKEARERVLEASL